MFWKWPSPWWSCCGWWRRPLFSLLPKLAYSRTVHGNKFNFWWKYTKRQFRVPNFGWVVRSPLDQRLRSPWNYTAVILTEVWTGSLDHERSEYKMTCTYVICKYVIFKTKTSSMREPITSFRQVKTFSSSLHSDNNYVFVRLHFSNSKWMPVSLLDSWVLRTNYDIGDRSSMSAWHKIQ